MNWMKKFWGKKKGNYEVTIPLSELDMSKELKAKLEMPDRSIGWIDDRGRNLRSCLPGHWSSARLRWLTTGR